MGEDTIRILVSVDGRESCVVALHRADALARALGAELHAVRVLPPTWRIHPFFRHSRAWAAQASELRRREAAEEAHRFCELMLARSLRRTSVHACEGELPGALLSSALELGAGLIVVGEALESARSRGLVKRLVCESPVPVLVARPAAPSNTIVAATDFSNDAFPALTRAADLAARTDARVVFVHNVTPASPLPTATMFGLTEILRGDPVAEAVARRSLDLGVVAGLVDAQADTTVLTHPRAADAILELTESLEADLVVVGTHRRRGLARLVAAGTAVKVALRAPRCVLTVPLDPAGAAA